MGTGVRNNAGFAREGNVIRVSAEAFDIMGELEKMRGAPDPRCKTFTHEQDVFMWAARGPSVQKKIGWDVMRSLWNSKWGDAPNCETMRRRINALAKQGGPEPERG